MTKSPKVNSTDIEIVYGIHSCLECIQNPKRNIIKILCTQSVFIKYSKLISNFDYEICDAKKLNITFGQIKHQNFIVKARFLHHFFNKNLFSNLSKVAILDKLQDPYNIGSIIRCAWVFGIEAIILPKNHTPIFSNVICHVASGAKDHVKIIIATNLNSCILELKKMDFWVIGMDAKAQLDITDIKFQMYNKIVMVLGSEGKGMSLSVQQNCDLLCKIPLNNTSADSLNVSNAAAISFFSINSNKK